MRISEIEKLLEGITPGEWQWHIEDYSMAILHGTDMFENSVMAVSPCKSCREGKTEWAWGRCTTPKEADAQFIAAAPQIIRSLIAQVKEARKQAFVEAAELAIKITESDDCLTDPCLGKCSDCVSEIFRRKAEQEIGNSGRVDDNDDIAE